MTTLFISDLHLDAAHPDIGAQFLDFLGGEARAAEALYILGDLFEAWVGDDDDDPYLQGVQGSLRELTAAGIPGYFLHGNRDFLVGAGFSAATGFELLDAATVVDLYGQRVLLMHGDQLCTDDHDYQAFRAMVRNPEWQRQFLGLPLPQRRQLAAQARDASRQAGASKALEITDVNARAVAAAMDQHGVDTLLHGHTHRPAIHHGSSAPGTRIVLGDWYTQGSVLRWDAHGYRLVSLSR